MNEIKYFLKYSSGKSSRRNRGTFILGFTLTVFLLGEWSSNNPYHYVIGLIGVYTTIEGLCLITKSWSKPLAKIDKNS
jgi:hypothetical protein